MSIEEKYCSKCVFWDYGKNRCSEWFKPEMTIDSLHRCAEMVMELKRKEERKETKRLAREECKSGWRSEE